MKATKNSHDWSCEYHGTYGWRGESCLQCPEAPSEIDDLRSANADLKRQLEESSTGALTCANRILQQEQNIGELHRQLEEAKDAEAFANSARSQFEKMLHKQAETISGFEKQLAESQAREARLREALERIVPRFCVGYETKSDALALPHNDTALREYRESVIDECVTFLAKAKGQTRNHLLRQGLAFAVEELPELKSVVESTSKGDLNVI